MTLVTVTTQLILLPSFSQDDIKHRREEGGGGPMSVIPSEVLGRKGVGESQLIFAIS